MSTKANLESYVKLLNPKTLSMQSIQLLKDYQKYFETYLTDDTIAFNKFKEFFFINQHPNLDEKQVTIYKEVIDQVQNVPLEGISCTQIITAFEQQELYNQLHTDLDKNVDINTLFLKVEKHRERVNLLQGSSEGLEEEMDLTLALTYTDRSKGLQWRLNCLREHFQGGLINGDFLILAGYTDSGKTSMLASEVSYMAEQLEGDDWIAWLNTEGNWEQILPRLYQATLNCTHQDLTKFTESAILKYTEKMHGNKNRIRVLNFQRKGIKDVENLIKKHPPKLIVFDLLDHLQGFDKYVGSEGSVVEKYGALYQWGREIATKYCPVIAVSQLNRNGNDNPYPPITEMSGSGEKKQAAATAIIMLGGMEGNSTERYLSTPKNKISGSKGFRRQVAFDPLRSRFEG